MGAWQARELRCQAASILAGYSALGRVAGRRAHAYPPSWGAITDLALLSACATCAAGAARSAMAFGKALVLLVAALAVAAAQHDPIPDPHDPAYDPFFHPTGRPKQNTLAGATSQQSPGFPTISKLLPLVQADSIGPILSSANTKVIVVATWDFGNPAAVRPQGPHICRQRADGVLNPGRCHSIYVSSRFLLRIAPLQVTHLILFNGAVGVAARHALSLGANAALWPGVH